MKRKNKKLLIIVGILLLVGGISLAYYTSTNELKGNGSNMGATIKTVEGSTIMVEGNISFSDVDLFPGHKNVSGIKVTATGDNELISFNILWKGTNTLSPLNYTIYKTSSNLEVEATCKKVTNVVDGAQQLSEECSISNIDKLGKPVATGSIEKSNDETQVVIAETEFITSTSDGLSMYYYVVIEYPNLNEDQSSDIGGFFSGEIIIEEGDAEADINILAMYVEDLEGNYNKTEKFNDRLTDEAYYDLDYDKSFCTNDTTIENWDWDKNNVVFSNLTTSGTSCYLYFKIVNRLTDGVGQIMTNMSTINERTDFSAIVEETTTGVIYKADDDDGDTYYFAGNPTDNWVKFAGFYWRIIRINGDGSIRMIYAGTDPSVTTGEGTQIGESVFNPGGDNNMHVGYMYTNGEVHGLGTSSTIKNVLDTWYAENLLSYTNYIDQNAGFCGDRTPYSSQAGADPTATSGTGTVNTWYGAYIRLSTNKTPTFKCPESSDLYTKNGSTKGNKVLTYPIGLITADEVSYAGGMMGKKNHSNYLYTSQEYWTFSPRSRYKDTYSLSPVMIFSVSESASFSSGYALYDLGVRPVINLKSGILFTSESEGTASKPYEVMTE